jgi:peroxiredoxin Q/BCP
MAAIKVGDRVPNFSLPSQTGTTVNISDLIGTAESCAFRDSYEVFTDAGAEVIGISADSPQSHQQFAQKYNLPFTLLSDSDNRVRKLFGVPATLFVLPGRVTYIIDKEGIVRHIFDSMLDFKAHVTESLNTIKSF